MGRVFPHRERKVLGTSYASASAADSSMKPSSFYIQELQLDLSEVVKFLNPMKNSKAFVSLQTALEIAEDLMKMKQCCSEP